MKKFIFIKKYCEQEFITIINKIHKSIYSNMIRAIFVDELSTIETISKKYDILPSFVEMLIRIFRKEGYVVCNNNLTDITVTPAGEEYFEEVISQ